MKALPMSMLVIFAGLALGAGCGGIAVWQSK